MRPWKRVKTVQNPTRPYIPHSLADFLNKQFRDRLTCLSFSRVDLIKLFALKKSSSPKWKFVYSDTSFKRWLLKTSSPILTAVLTERSFLQQDKVFVPPTEIIQKFKPQQKNSSLIRIEHLRASEYNSFLYDAASMKQIQNNGNNTKRHLFFVFFVFFPWKIRSCSKNLAFGQNSNRQEKNFQWTQFLRQTEKEIDDSTEN